MCAALEITCLHSEKKPDWMDGAEREKEMAERLKSMVKSKASERREKKWASSIYLNDLEDTQALPGNGESLMIQGMANHTLDASIDHDSHDSGGTSSHTPGTNLTDDSSSPEYGPSESRRSVANTRPFEPALEATSNCNHVGTFKPPYHTKGFPDAEYERELNFVMIYLDYVFPYMSPFYRPPLLQAGRGWLLVLLMRNKPLFHTALSLASYFFSLMGNDQSPGHDSCTQKNRLELQKQQQLTIKSLQSSMQGLTSIGVATCLRESLNCLEGITQLLSFDVTIGNATNWQMHLDAASSLFEQIIAHHATDNTRPWYSILAYMDRLAISITFPRGQHPWSGSQASWRFLTVNLLWTDILAATALGNAPRLEVFHQQLLVGEDPDLKFSDFFGCHNWVMLIIGQIAVLHAWKKEMRRLRALSMIELVKKGECVERKLRAGIEELNVVPMALFHDPSARTPDQPFAGSGFETITEAGGLQTTHAQAFHTKIWAKAALTYLMVVVSGFQPTLPEIQENIAETIDLFRMMRSPSSLRTLIWPFAVTGCLCMPEQEEFFRSLASNMGTMQVFGTVKEASQIMSAVWTHRACIDADLWDIATCLNTLGHSSLLV